MFATLKKSAESLAYLYLLFLSWKWISGQLDFGFTVSCVILSGAWLALTFHGVGGLFRTYFDVLSRLKVRIPLFFGTVLAALVVLTPWDWAAMLGRLTNPAAMLEHLSSPLPMVAALELLGWLTLYFAYRRNASRFKQQGHGPLPKGAWVNPDPAALQPGDLILTSGRVARTMHEAVGHGELVVDLGKGELYTLTSFMEKGAMVQPVKAMAQDNKSGHYIAMRLTKPLSAEQLALVPGLVEIMLKQNLDYIAGAKAARASRFQRFHVPGFVRRMVEKKFPITGYDWFGLFTGRLARDHWTCVGACLELFRRIGVKTNKYGTGLFGLGTGVLDPIMPVRFLDDQALRLLSEADAEAFQKSQKPL